ncbi:MAG: hypothetical protein M0000_01150 [Actinomycetota bacterium]|nr:hypothetical protein [Actinomycetota bacterium]
MNRTKGQRWAVIAAGALAAGGALAACGSASASSTSTTAAPKAAPVVVHEAMTILTGGMIADPGWPAFVPGSVTVPAGATVDMTIYSYDDGTAPLPSSLANYAKASGVTNLTENGTPVTSMDPSAVAHTFTIPALGINVPIGVMPTATGVKKPLVVQFTFKATKSGSYEWQCMAPCGSGSDGMEGAMATDNFMKGTFTVA